MVPLLPLALAAALAAAPAKPAPWRSTPMPPAMPTPVEQGTLPVDGAKLWFATYGAGEPVVLLHGGAGNTEHWSLQLPALVDRFQVIVLDARGHGRSTRDDRPFSYHQLAEDVLALLDHRKLARASLVGWSDGGAVALDFAIHHPDRVHRVVAFATNYDLTGMRSGGGPHATFASYFERCAADYRRLSPTPAGYAAFQQALRQMWRTQPQFTRAQLRAITARTLVIDGEHDEILRQEHVRELAALIPGAKLRLVPDASHFAHWQQPQDFNAAVREFLSAGPQ